MNAIKSPDSNDSVALIPVLLYHSVASNASDGLPAYNVAPSEFIRHLELVVESGRKVVSFRELSERLRTRSFDETPLAAVTFDDGFADNLKACEALAERGIPATVFVTSSFVGEAKMLGASQLHELAALPGIDVGAHSVTHPYLDSIQRERAEIEIMKSKTQLEDVLGGAVDTFAYPHGAYDRNVRELVKRCGFTGAAAVKNAISHREDDPFAVSRWTIETGVSLETLSEILAGTGAPRGWTNERLRTRAARLARRLKAGTGATTKTGESA
ncbi:MAG: polysaccharide deacetylase family protein [Solirubrobacterales bacterium]